MFPGKDPFQRSVINDVFYFLVLSLTEVSQSVLQHVLTFMNEE